MASPPKHLWSGDWERESNDRPQPPPAEPTPSYDVAPEPEPEPRAADTRSSQRGLIVGAAVVAALVIVGVVLAFTLGDSKSNPQASAQASTPSVTPIPRSNGGSGIQTLSTPQSTTPQQTPTTLTPTATLPPSVAAGPTYDWLGMQINAIGTNVTVDAITPGSTADAAGVNPGDVIEAVNTSQIQTVAQLESAVKAIKLGQRFTLIVDRGSTPVTIVATLTGRPARA